MKNVNDQNFNLYLTFKKLKNIKTTICDGIILVHSLFIKLIAIQKPAQGKQEQFTSI